MVTIRALRPEDDLRALIPLSTAFFQEYAAHHELFELGEVREQAPFYRIRKVGAISGLMVRADHRRQGLGARLIAETAQFFRRQGAAYYTVYTSAANASALRLYQRAGLTPLHLNLVGKCEE